MTAPVCPSSALASRFLLLSAALLALAASACAEDVPDARSPRPYRETLVVEQAPVLDSTSSPTALHSHDHRGRPDSSPPGHASLVGLGGR